MKLATPRWWYVRDGAPMALTRGLLKPVSWLWAAATARRIARAIPYDAGVPVICVGGLTVGGAGKTPKKDGGGAQSRKDTPRAPCRGRG